MASCMERNWSRPFASALLSAVGARPETFALATARLAFGSCTAALARRTSREAARSSAAGSPTKEELRGAPAEPDDAAEVRAQIAVVEKLLPTFVDRGATLYFLAAAKQHLGESREAFDLLKECMTLDEGFDPSGGPEFAGLRGEHSFTELVERARQHFPAVAMARLALATEEKDLVPEGLAWDPKRELFYLSSLHRKKIVQITPDSHTSDFVPPQPELLPVLGIRLDPDDGTIWANAFQDAGASAGKTQLLH